jgi:hypothetical protein
MKGDGKNASTLVCKILRKRVGAFDAIQITQRIIAHEIILFILINHINNNQYFLYT